MEQAGVVQDQAGSVKVDSCEMACECECRSLVSRPTWVIASVLLVVAVGYVLFQRVGTSANVELVEHSKNLAGGFVALGRTEQKPGFLLLSALDEGKVEVNATQVSNWVTGTHAIVKVATPQDAWRRRLRGPLAIVVDDAGVVTAAEVDWSAAELDQLRAAMDCAKLGATRCGAPFADLHEALTQWSASRVPEVIRLFLDRHGLAEEHSH